MEDVPFKFCDSAVRLLSFERYRNSQPFSSVAWQNAIDALLENRINVDYRIEHKDGVWRYSIGRKANNHYEHISFEELQKVNRRNLRIWHVEIEKEPLTAMRASFEEITKLVKFSLPFVNMASLEVKNTKDFPQDDLLKLLSYLSTSSIEELFTKNNRDGTWAALSVYLNSESLKKVFILDTEIPDQMKAALKEYVLQTRFTYFMLEKRRWSFC